MSVSVSVFAVDWAQLQKDYPVETLDPFAGPIGLLGHGDPPPGYEVPSRELTDSSSSAYTEFTLFYGSTYERPEVSAAVSTLFGFASRFSSDLPALERAGSQDLPGLAAVLSPSTLERVSNDLASVGYEELIAEAGYGPDERPFETRLLADWVDLIAWASGHKLGLLILFH